jgi:cupin fold WbuC family metalloprotein
MQRSKQKILQERFMQTAQQNVFYNSDNVVTVGPEWLERIKRTAMTSPLRRARLCLHQSADDPVHEMIIALQRDCLFRPHRHPTKVESIHMIEGRVAIVVFDENARPVKSYLLAPPGLPGNVCYRLCASIFHAVLPMDDIVVYQETTSGPFRKGEAVFLPGAPDDHAELKRFLRAAALSAGFPEDYLRSGGW